MAKYSPNPSETSGETQAKRWANLSEIWAKPMRKLSRIDRYEHVERSMHMFISTVMNMWNGRYQGRRITFLFDNQRYYQKKYYLYTQKRHEYLDYIEQYPRSTS